MVITNNVVHIFKQMKNRATQWTKINSLFTERIVLTWLALVMGSHVQVKSSKLKTKTRTYQGHVAELNWNLGSDGLRL